jgi:hypothetical protein
MESPLARLPDTQTSGTELTELSRKHLEMIRDHFEKAPEPNSFAKGYRELFGSLLQLANSQKRFGFGDRLRRRRLGPRFSVSRPAIPRSELKRCNKVAREKGNAVREGFSVAEGNILMILDADLTMPPEELPKFFEAVANEHCDFANGSRLVYPMEHKAMQFLKMCANKAFSILFTWLLGQPVKDTLCGTKALAKEDYSKIAANRSYFGDFDPFGTSICSLGPIS